MKDSELIEPEKTPMSSSVTSEPSEYGDEKVMKLNGNSMILI